MIRRSINVATRPLLAAAAGAALALAVGWGLGVFESGPSASDVTAGYLQGFEAGSEQALAARAAVEEEVEGTVADGPRQAVPLSVIREVSGSEDGVPGAVGELWPVRCILDQVLRTSCWVDVQVSERAGTSSD